MEWDVLVGHFQDLAGCSNTYWPQVARSITIDLSRQLPIFTVICLPYILYTTLISLRHSCMQFKCTQVKQIDFVA